MVWNIIRLSEGVEIFCELISVKNVIEIDLFGMIVDCGYCSVQIMMVINGFE